jgi:glyceraldehyde 3-phosphate dehydrogenase
MSTSVAINGLGRIGRAILKLVTDEPALKRVAINDLMDIETLAYLLRFDTVYGRYPKSVVVDGDDLAIAGHKVRTLRSRDPLDLPWRELGVDNEWGYANQMLREAVSVARGAGSPST